MTIPMWCLLVGMILPYIWAFASVPFRVRQLGAVDLAYPRAQAEQLVDAGSAVVGSQGNAWEALIVFAVANLMAFMAGVSPEGSWSIAALVWLVARVFHGVFYVGNIPTLRVICFVTGMAMSLWIVFMAATA